MYESMGRMYRTWAFYSKEGCMIKIKVLKKAEIRVMPADILALEALRQRLRGDTLKKAYREGR